MDYDFPYIGNVIIPSDELIFVRGVGIPPTSIYRNGRCDKLPCLMTGCKVNCPVPSIVRGRLRQNDKEWDHELATAKQLLFLMGPQWA